MPIRKVLTTKANFLALPAKNSSYDKSKIVILSAPYEKTVSYGGGTGKAPRAIIKASQYVEFFDDEFFTELCFTHGIATLPPLDFKSVSGKQAMKKLEKTITNEIEAGKFVVTLGGEHTISSATIGAHFAAYPKMSVLHFDAHSDLRDSYSGTKYSHACFMARVDDDYDFPMERVVQVGIRAQCKEEAEFIKKKKVKTFYATNIRRGKHGAAWQKSVVKALSSNDVYITFDIDYFDPAIMPTTGTPEPDGFLWNETMEIFRELRASGKRIVGFDMVELIPDPKQHHATYLVAKLVYRMLNFAFV